MGYKRKSGNTVRRRERIREDTTAISSFSVNFEEKVAPYIPQKTAENIRKSFDFDIVKRMNTEEMRTFTKDLAKSANMRIMNYMRSKYRATTTEFGGYKPIPTAYKRIIEREGELLPWDIKNINKMERQKLEKEISELRKFLASQSSILGKKGKYGWKKIQGEIYDRWNIRSKEYGIVPSEDFESKVWEVYAKLKELGVTPNLINNMGTNEMQSLVSTAVLKNSNLTNASIALILKDRLVKAASWGQDYNDIFESSVTDFGTKFEYSDDLL